MKKMLLLVMCVPMVLAAQNGVKVSSLNVNSGTVTFDVSWNRNAPELQSIVWFDSVWVFVDYNAGGVMTRLPLSAGATLTYTSAPDVGRVIQYPDNNKGVWVVGNAKSGTNTSGSFSATVKLLTATADIAGACAYASNYPPVGEYTATDNIKFTGTPMYDLVLKHSGGSTVTQQVNSPFIVPSNYTLASFTDKTGAPGIITPLTYTLIASASGFCEGADSVSFALQGTQKGVKYQLYRDGTTAVGNVLSGTGSAATFSGTFNTAGAYTARTVAEGAYQATPMSGTQTITVNPLPVATVSPSSVSYDQTAALSATVTAGTTTAMTYTWNIGGTSTTTTVNNTTTQVLNANTTYTVQVMNSNGCLGAASAPATITAAPSHAYATGPAISACGLTWTSFLNAPNSPLTCGGVALYNAGFDVPAVCPDPWRAPTRSEVVGCPAVRRIGHCDYPCKACITGDLYLRYNGGCAAHHPAVQQFEKATWGCPVRCVLK